MSQHDKRRRAEVVAVCANPARTFSKQTCARIQLITGLGVEGDAHFGATVQHRSRVAQDPTQPNLRQVHLIHAELHDELKTAGFIVNAGDMGENITTRGVSVLDLPAGARLRIGSGGALIEITGLRNPCAQIDAFQTGLLAAVLDRDATGALVRKAGVMGIVIAGGPVSPGDTIDIETPPLPHRLLERV